MAHPLRYELLLKLNGRTASPNELSKEVDASVGTVSYHIRLLEQMGFAELVDEKLRRGAVEHFYRATQRAWFSKQRMGTTAGCRSPEYCRRHARFDLGQHQARRRRQRLR